MENSLDGYIAIKDVWSKRGDNSFAKKEVLTWQIWSC